MDLFHYPTQLPQLTRRPLQALIMQMEVNGIDLGGGKGSRGG